MVRVACIWCLQMAARFAQLRAEIAYGGHGMAWSPDGLRLAFDDYTDEEPSVVVVVITPDGYAGGEHSFSETAQEYTYWDVGWSPDGLRLAFVAVSQGNIDIYTMKADGTELQRLTDHPADDQSPVWSPDSTQIAFISNRDEKFYSDVFVIDLATGSEKRLTWGAEILSGRPVLRQLSWVKRAL